MSAIKQAVSWWCFVEGEMTPQKLLRAAADIGYVAVELVEQEYWLLVKEYGLAIASMIVGIASLICLGPILGAVAIILGAVALSQIKKNPDVIGGKPFAVTGVITGSVSVVICGGFGVLYIILMAIGAANH